MTEQWRPVTGWPGYEVSDHGRVRSLARVIPRTYRGSYSIPETILAQSLVGTGYLGVTLNDSGRRRTARVHLLVLAAFVGPRPDGLQGCHGDGDVTNNHVSNLRWDTAAGNAADRSRHGTQNNQRKTECPKGHPYDATNTRRKRNGWRDCRTCDNERRRVIPARGKKTGEDE